MPKKELTPKQVAARKAASERMKAMHAAKKAAQETRQPEETVVEEQTKEQSMERMQAQIDEILETNALLKAALLRGESAQTKPSNGIRVSGEGRLLGEVEKYLVDPANYPDPTHRLVKEPRLESIAFQFNYDMDYRVETATYETKTGVNTKEPRFIVHLNRIVLDAQGNRVKVINPKNNELEDKFYVARKLIFHEDPQAALVIARENHISVEAEDEKTFLDEMRYLRVREWLFDYFWPKPSDSIGGIIEENIGGQLVQVFTRSSENSSEIDFSQIGDSKLRT